MYFLVQKFKNYPIHIYIYVDSQNSLIFLFFFLKKKEKKMGWLAKWGWLKGFRDGFGYSHLTP